MLDYSFLVIPNMISSIYVKAILGNRCVITRAIICPYNSHSYLFFNAYFLTTPISFVFLVDHHTVVVHTVKLQIVL